MSRRKVTDKCASKMQLTNIFMSFVNAHIVIFKLIK